MLTDSTATIEVLVLRIRTWAPKVDPLGAVDGPSICTVALDASGPLDTGTVPHVEGGDDAVTPTIPAVRRGLGVALG